MVRFLLEAGAEVEHQNENGHTPLMEAASCGHVGGCGLPHTYKALSLSLCIYTSETHRAERYVVHNVLA